MYKRIESIKEKNIDLYIIISITAILIIIKNCFFTNLPSIIIFAFYTFSFVFLKGKKKLVYYFFLIPCNTNEALYFVNVIFSVIWIVCDILNSDQNKNIRIKKSSIITYILIFYEIIHSIIALTYGYHDNIIKICGFALLLYMLDTLLKEEYEKDLIKKISLAWILGVIILGMGMYTEQYKIFGQQIFRLGSNYGVEILTTKWLYQNSNTIGCFAIVGFIASIMYGYYEKKYIYIITSIAMLVIGISTGSRAFLLAVVITILNMAIFYRPKVIKLKTVIVTVIIITAIVFLNNYFRFDEYIKDMYSSRMEESDITGGRSSIYTEYYKYFKDNKLFTVFGVGMQSYPNKIEIISGGEMKGLMAHNTIIEVIAAWGIIGLILTIYYFCSLIKNYMFNNKKVNIKTKFKSLIPIIEFAICSMTIMFFFGYYYMFPALIIPIFVGRYIIEKESV